MDKYPFPRTPYAVKVNRREYYALITYMDEQIGRIINALEESGEKKNSYKRFGGTSEGNRRYS